MTSGSIPVQRLAEDRDMLANVDIAGQPVATARFAGGREYRAIVGAEGSWLWPMKRHCRLCCNRRRW